jgi:hypothetical protein
MMLSLPMTLWLKCKALALASVVSRTDQADRDPLRLSMFLLDECRKRGVQVHQPATPMSLITDNSNNTITALTIKLNDNSETQSKSPSVYST